MELDIDGLNVLRWHSCVVSKQTITTV